PNPENAGPDGQAATTSRAENRTDPHVASAPPPCPRMTSPIATHLSQVPNIHWGPTAAELNCSVRLSQRQGRTRSRGPHSSANRLKQQRPLVGMDLRQRSPVLATRAAPVLPEVMESRGITHNDVSVVEARDELGGGVTVRTDTQVLRDADGSAL